MSEQLRCKRIIGGRTYNTETSTRLANWTSNEPGQPIYDGVEDEQALYQTRHGAFFLYLRTDIYAEGERGREGIKPLTHEEAAKWMEKYGTSEEFVSVFGEVPEAGDPEAKFTVRMPEVLHKRLVILAEKRKQSLNAWVVRCLEGCAEAAEKDRH